MSPPDARTAVYAMVQIGSQETRYRRAGRGSAVLLLTESASSAERDRVFDALCDRFRVIEPARGDAEGTAGWEAWLRGVVDGLGLDRPSLVVDAPVADRARAFARAEPDRAGTVVVVGPGDDLRTVLPDPRRDH